MIRMAAESDLEPMIEIINDAAQAYKGVIPADRWREPYMAREELLGEIEDGVVFWCLAEGGALLGVMGIQDRGEVALIRHAYVRNSSRGRGIGTQLLRHLVSKAAKPILVGTWAAASWAISFYEKNGFTRVPAPEKDRLLRKYWDIPERQIETSVVLGDPRYSSLAAARKPRR